MRAGASAALLLLLLSLSVALVVLRRPPGFDDCGVATRGARRRNATAASTAARPSPPDDDPLGRPDDDDASDASDAALARDGAVPRAFPVYPHPFPCLPPDEGWLKTSVLRSPTTEGFLFAKEMKAGSSTAAGVAIRVAQKEAMRAGTGWEACKARFDHAYAHRMKFGERDRTKSFLWTVVREPDRRATSQFFHFEVSRKKVEPTDENFKHYLLMDMSFDNQYLQTLSTTDYMGAAANHTGHVNGILADYDFVGVTERMDESLVVLSMLLNLELSDVLYLSAKGSGSFDGAGLDECQYIVPAFVSPGMRDFFANDEQWEMLTRGDALLHRAARRSLDLTIDALGRDAFEVKLAEYKRLKGLVEERCAGKVTLPCDAGGRRNEPNGCVWMDSACGGGCIDDAVRSANRTTRGA